MLEHAMSCIRRGWYVFPCKPKSKEPQIRGGYLSASNDEAQVREWWAKFPNANPAIATGPSRIVVLDTDKGLTPDTVTEWAEAHGIPATYAVRTGSRPEFKVQFYFSVPDGVEVPSFNRWEDGEQAGDIRGTTWGHVMAAGAMHKSGTAYEVLWDLPLAPVPDYVRGLNHCPPKDKEGKPLPPRTLADSGPISEWRNDAMTRLLGQARAQGQDDDELRATAHKINEERMEPPLDEDELDGIIQHACAWEMPKPDAIPVLSGKAPEPRKDWRSYYHTVAEHDNVGPPRFLIEDFLPEQSIMGIGAFVGQKKTLAALNIVHSLCSGEPLFGKYKVTRKPARVLYLGPENGLISFSDRVNRIGLREYLGKTFYYSTMSIREKRPLTALLPEEIHDAAIVIDTAIRFTEGSENDAALMKEFAEHAFFLIRNKAACVIMLHHSPKSMTKSNELTLENSFRGTGELSAFLSVALAMRTQDMDEEYESASLFRFVKQRDFEPRPSSFEVTTSRENCRMTFVDGSAGAVVALGNTANKDGKDEAAIALMKANRQLSNVKMSKFLTENAGIDRSKEWVRLKRGELGIGGVKVGSNL